MYTLGVCLYIYIKYMSKLQRHRWLAEMREKIIITM